MKQRKVPPSDHDIRRIIQGMMRELVANVVRVGGAVYVNYERPGGCGEVSKSILEYLAAHVPARTKVVVMESPKLDRTCKTAWIKPRGSMTFVAQPIRATSTRLGLSSSKAAVRRHAQPYRNDIRRCVQSVVGFER